MTSARNNCPYKGDKFSCVKHHKLNTREAAMLISLRDELYYRDENGKVLKTSEERWTAMDKDLAKRCKDRPYIFKLVERIKADRKRMGELREYEKERGNKCPGFDLAYCLTECPYYNDAK